MVVRAPLAVCHLLLLLSGLLPAATGRERADDWPDLPDPVGRAGMFTGVVDDGGTATVMIASGCAMTADTGDRVQHTYPTATAAYDREGWTTLADPPSPRAACAGPAPARYGGPPLRGGDPAPRRPKGVPRHAPRRSISVCASRNRRPGSDT